MTGGKAWTPGGRPKLKPVLARDLPQSEVARLSLSRIHLAPRAREELVGRVPRELAVGREAGDVVVDRSADLVCMTACDQLLDERDHLRDVVRGVRILVRTPDVELGGVFHELVRVVRRDLFPRLVLQAR